MDVIRRPQAVGRRCPVLGGPSRAARTGRPAGGCYAGVLGGKMVWGAGAIRGFRLSLAEGLERYLLRPRLTISHIR